MPYEFTERPMPYEGRHRLTRANRRTHIRWKLDRRVQARRNLDQVHHHGTRT